MWAGFLHSVAVYDHLLSCDANYIVRSLDKKVNHLHDNYTTPPADEGHESWFKSSDRSTKLNLVLKLFCQTAVWNQTYAIDRYCRYL